MHALAWPIVEPIFAEKRRDDAARCRALLGTGLASSDVEEILGAAEAGRVDVLFVPAGQHVWGGSERSHRTPVDTAGSITEPDLLEEMAAHTLLAGGTVHAAGPDEMPSPARAAAIFRY